MPPADLGDLHRVDKHAAHLGGLIGFVEDAVGNAHRKTYQIARRRLGLAAAQHEIELSLQDIEIFVLIRMDMRRHEGAGRQRRVPGEGMLGAVFRHIGLAEDIPENSLHALVSAGDAGYLAFHCLVSLPVSYLPGVQSLA